MQPIAPPKSLKLSGYLIVRRDGTETRWLKTKPEPAPGELAIPIKLDIPDAIFEPPRLPEVSITIDQSILPQIQTLDEHTSALQDAGIKVRFTDGRQKDKGAGQ